jgi:hypothetical protein
MHSAPHSKNPRKAILTDTQVRHVTRLMKAMLGDSVMSIGRRLGLRPADLVRFMPVAARLAEAREARGLTVKGLAKRLGAPQYRIKQIESAEIMGLDAPVLARYVDAMGLREWFGQWESANRSLARRLGAKGRPLNL